MMESKFVDVMLNQNINNLQNEQFVTEQHEDEPEVRHVDPLEAELLESIDNSIKTWNIPPALLALDDLHFRWFKSKMQIMSYIFIILRNDFFYFMTVL